MLKREIEKAEALLDIAYDRRVFLKRSLHRINRLLVTLKDADIITEYDKSFLILHNYIDLLI